MTSMAPGRVTIVDLARELGLSKTTVSDALQGRGQVAAETRDRVLAMAVERGYRSNRAARSLRSSTLGAIGLYIPPIVREFSFYMEFAFGAAHGAAEWDLDLMLIARDPELSAERPFQVDGAIVVDPLPDDVTVQRMKRQGIPVVTAGRAPGVPDVDAVIEAPHRASATAVLDRLWAAGRRRPAFMSSDRQFFSSWASDVLTAYTDWCGAHHVEPLVREVSVVAPPEDLRLVVKELVGGPPDVDALVCGPQGFAGRSLSVLLSLGRVVGEDIDLASLVGDPATELIDPGISSVDIRPYAFGRDAAVLLNERLRSDTPAGSERTHATELRFASHLGPPSTVSIETKD